MAYSPEETTGSRLAQLVGALSLATDLGNGQPPETALRLTLTALDLADEAGASDGDRECIYWGGLLRFAGCTSTSVEETYAASDDIALRPVLLAADFADANDLARRLGGALAPAAAAQFLRTGPILAPAVLPAHCEVAISLARRLGMPGAVLETLDAYHERWDGGGPRGLAGEAVPLPARLLTLAQVALTNASNLTRDELLGLLRSRAGGQLDPSLVERFCRALPTLPPPDVSVWDRAMAAEPGAPRTIDPTRLTELATVLADHSDLKSPYTLGHARGTARLALAAARTFGLDPERCKAIELAAMLHDVGRSGLPTSILDKPGPLNRAEHERARSHAATTERVLAASSALAPVARLAASNHERLDGSGYPRGLTGSAVSTEARILAVAAALQGLTEERAYRPAMPVDSALVRLDQEAKSGLFDPRAVEAVAAAATGVRTRRRLAREWPAGLSDREVEVLRLVARGWTNRQIADHLVISARTVQQHTIHIYDKCGVSSRAAATLFAAQHELFSSFP